MHHILLMQLHSHRGETTGTLALSNEELVVSKIGRINSQAG